MIRIYTKDGEVFLEDEAEEIAREIVETEELFLEPISDMTPSALWSMLSYEWQETLMNEAIQQVLEEDFTYRDIDEKELKNVLHA